MKEWIASEKTRKKQDKNESEIYDTIISSCCCKFENAATRLKDATTRLSYKFLFQCPNQSR